MAAAFALAFPAAAQDDAGAENPEDSIVVGSRPNHLVLEDDFTIDVILRDRPIRLEVDSAHWGPVALNIDLVLDMELRGQPDTLWNFGGVEVQMVTTPERITYDNRTVNQRIGWTAYNASHIADGVIGIHDLPYDLVTFLYGERTARDRVQVFEMERRGRGRFRRHGIELDVGEDRLFAMISNRIGLNLVSAGTANYIATRQEGRFIPDTDGLVEIIPGLYRPTRTMQLAYPIDFGDLRIDNFSVRMVDHGRANSVGEAEEGDPRFEENTILVTDRRRRGRDDHFTRIGRQQFRACSEITYDLEEREIRMRCSDMPIDAD
ncbi:hypothetical protein [Aurantiacibacter sp. MUD61]|uniref:hypothetical protein n=1 Tax=Aurantiacibacter sp. MUD61 TaxID=3009083 RepID=UPI0022F087D3|nr:hypothetical protein [Aurantiacibacter sp. MUD61]